MLSASWLSTKLAVDTVRINAMRRAGELLAVREPGSTEWQFPAWQFDAGGHVKPDVARVLAAAREQGIRLEQLQVLLERRSGLTSGERLVDLLRAGRANAVVDAVRSS